MSNDYEQRIAAMSPPELRECLTELVLKVRETGAAPARRVLAQWSLDDTSCCGCGKDVPTVRHSDKYYCGECFVLLSEGHLHAAG